MYPTVFLPQLLASYSGCFVTFFVAFFVAFALCALFYKATKIATKEVPKATNGQQKATFFEYLGAQMVTRLGTK